MGGLLAKAQASAQVEIDAIVKALEEADIDVNIATDIGKALADNDFKAFETLTTNLLNGNEIEINQSVRAALIDQLDNVRDNFANNDLFKIVLNVQSDPALSMASVCALLAVTLATIFSRDMSGLAACVLLFAIFAVVMGGAWYISHIYLQPMLDKLKFKDTKQQDKVDHRKAMGSAASESRIIAVKDVHKDQQKVIQYAYGVEHVSEDILQKAQHINAIGAIFGVSQECRKMVSLLQGTIPNWEKKVEELSLSNSEGLKEQLKELDNSVKHISSVAIQQSDMLVNIAEGVKAWTEVLNATKKTIERRLLRIPSMAETFMSTKAKKKKKQILQTICKDADSDIRKVLNEVEKIGENMVKVDADMILQTSSQLLTMLAYNPQFDAALSKQIKENIETREDLRQKYLDAKTKHSAKLDELTQCKDRKQVLKEQLEMRLHDYNARRDEQNRIDKRLGRGTITMKGKPPKDDPNALKYWKHWRDGDFDLCEPYQSLKGRTVVFSIEIDPKLTSKQEESEKILLTMNKEHDDLTDARRPGSITNQITALESQIAEHDALLPELKTKMEECKKEFDESSDQGSRNWLTFKQKYPVQFKEIETTFKVDEVICHASHWVVNGTPEVMEIKGLLKECKECCGIDDSGIDDSGIDNSDIDDPDIDDIKTLLTILNQCLKLLDDPTSNTPAFLKKIGGIQLRQMTKPRTHFLTLDNGGSDVQLTLAAQQGNDTPTEVD